jgi:hypothetical protein
MRKRVVFFFFGIEDDRTIDQTLGIKSLRREVENTKTVETKARATGAKTALVKYVFKVCLFIILKFLLSFKIYCKIGYKFLIIQQEILKMILSLPQWYIGQIMSYR